ncbi:MAG: hypothetical protein WCO33_03765 [bacterium]
MELLALFLLTVFFNLVPFFAPGTGLVVAFFHVKYEIPILLVVIVGVIASTIGRYILARFVGKITFRLLRQEHNQNLDYFKRKLNERGISVFLFSFLYCALPTPSNLLFLAIGASRAKLNYLLAGFFCGRFINYFYAVLFYKIVYQTFEETITSQYKSIGEYVFQIVTIILFVLFLLIDWQKLFEKKQLGFIINKKKEVTTNRN